MATGSVRQRHTVSCPRDSAGEILPHRCRGPWQYAFESGRTPAGTRKSVKRSGFPTRREAQEALDQELARLRLGVQPERQLSVAEYFDNWLDSKRNLRATTRRSYVYHVERHLKPALGSTPLQELRADQIDRLYTDLLSGRYGRGGTSTVHHAHRVLRTALNSAVKRRLLAWNPALHVEVPQHRRSRRVVWTPDEVAAFLEVARHHRLHRLFHLLVYTGMRRGEALGLHWRDVDLGRGQLTVSTQITDEGTGLALGPTKTQAGERVIPMDPHTVRTLRRQREHQDAEHQRWGSAWQDTGLVFTREDGTWLRPNSVTHLFQKLVAEAGVPRIRLHDLRHTHASIALAAGVDIKVVSDRLGHSSTSITQNLYMRVVPDVARTAADAIAAMLDGGSG